MSYPVVVAFLLAACSVSANVASCGNFFSEFADMHDGDAKSVNLDWTSYLTISQAAPVAWHVTVPLNRSSCTAMVDFSKSNKPAHPPVPLRVAIKQTTVGTRLIEFTDPSGTLNKDTDYPLNVWTTETELPATEPCPVFTDTTFQDMHDGDVKFVSLNANGALHMGQPGVWNLTTPLDLNSCKAEVDFSKSAKPAHPPGPLTVSIAVASGSDGRKSIIMTYTDPKSAHHPEYPLNIWEQVTDRY